MSNILKHAKIHKYAKYNSTLCKSTFTLKRVLVRDVRVQKKLTNEDHI